MVKIRNPGIRWDHPVPEGEKMNIIVKCELLTKPKEQTKTSKNGRIEWFSPIVNPTKNPGFAWNRPDWPISDPPEYTLDHSVLWEGTL